MKSIPERAKELSIIDDDGWCVRDPNIEAACTQIANEVVDKACEWLEENSDTFYTIEGDSTCEMLFETAEDMIAYFRKAMKGGNK